MATGTQTSAREAAQGVHVLGEPTDVTARVLTPEALEFVADLHRRFNAQRLALLDARETLQARFDADEEPTFPPETADVRAGDWRVAETPADLQDRRVEITGPTDAKMVINALNSGASCFMADFEDALSPTWRNVVEGQANLMDAIRRTLSFTSPEGKEYALTDRLAVLIVRPRGWHLRGAARDGGRRARLRVALRLRSLLLPQRPRAAGARQRTLLLPPEAGEPPRGAAVERRVRGRAGGARHPARNDPRHGADRDHPRRLRDGRDPPRAARARRRAQRRPLGLHLQHHQEVP
jgi:hypothetical protein